MNRSLAILGAGLAGALSFSAVALGGTDARPARAPSPNARQLSLRAIPASPEWRQYDEAPSSAVLRPVRVLDVTGAAADPQALTQPSLGAATTLTYASGGTVPSLVLDYGKDVGGTPTFDVVSTSGTAVQVSYSETLANLGNDGAATVALSQAGDPQRTRVFPVTGAGVVRATLIQGAERYERIELTSPGTVTLAAAGMIFSPPRETPSGMPGHFLSSDDLLNRIWYAGVYTLNLNQLSPGTLLTPGVVSQRHLLLDGAKRDRAVWSGDQLISGLTDYYASDLAYARDSVGLLLAHPATTAGELRVARGSMSQPGPLPGVCSPNPHFGLCATWSATYSMADMTDLYNYYLYTGDLAFVRRWWPAVLRQMRWDGEQVGADGLFTVSSVDGSDWNLEVVAGELTYVNAAYVLALESAAKLARALGQRTQARAWPAAALAVKRAVNRRLWDAATGVYDASTTERGSIVQDANVTAILAGIADPARARAIAGTLARPLQSPFGLLNVSRPVPAGYTQIVSPYMGSVNVLADFATGEGAAALALIRQEWGYMFSHDPGGVDWERIQLDGIPAGGGAGDSSAHAWSTGPTAALSEYVLGIRPATPGYRTWIVAPQPGQLRFAQGQAPTPFGAITSRWRRGMRDGSLTLTVIPPPNTTGVVEVPTLGTRRTIAMDGRVVWDGRRARGGARASAVAGAVAFAGLRGQHTFAWT